MPPLSPLSKSCIALAIAQSLSVHSAHAASIEVTSTLDDGTDCTLRDALASTNVGVDQANGCVIDSSVDVLGSNDTISFASNVSGNTITLANGQLAIDSSVSINPNGVTTTIDANQTSRVMAITGGRIALDHLIITGGSARSGGGLYALYSDVSLSNSSVSGNSANAGGGIDAYGSDVSLSNSTVSGNSATTIGGGLYVVTRSSVSLNNSTVSGNSALNHGGGFSTYRSDVSLNNSSVSGNSAPNNGGGLYASGSSSISLNNSTVSGNSAGNGGGIDTRADSNVSLSNSTVSDNLAAIHGGGFNVFNSPSVSLSNSTVSGNSANSGGGFYALDSDVSLNNSTVSDNLVATRGGGFRVSNSSSVSLNNSIVANSAGSNECSTNSSAEIVVSSDSIIDDASCGGGTIADPLLAPLADNGGPTLTHALLPGSPAIDSGTGTEATALDQRGLAAVGTRDIGAFEGQSLSLSLSPNTVSEGDGSSMGTITRTVLIDSALAVMLSSDDSSSVTVPSSITIPAGAASATFAITIVDNTVMNAANVSAITVNSVGYIESIASITVLDDDGDDSDGDGVLNDSDNCRAIANADQADLDGDGIGDTCDADIDGDGLPNQYENDNGLDPRNPLDGAADPDGDGFTNLEEFEFGSDPQVPDQDENGNGIPDAVENKPFIIAPILLLLDD